MSQTSQEGTVLECMLTDEKVKSKTHNAVNSAKTSMPEIRRNNIFK
jgi:hypothetical protein